MDDGKAPVSLDEMVGWAIDQGAFLPSEFACTREEAIEITRFFYSNLRAMVMQAEDFSILDECFDSVVRERDYLREICSDNGISIPPDHR